MIIFNKISYHIYKHLQEILFHLFTYLLKWNKRTDDESMHIQGNSNYASVKEIYYK